MCLDCGVSDKKLDLHHIIPRRRGGLNTMDNLVPLCRQCHWKYDPSHTKGSRRPTGPKLPPHCKLLYYRTNGKWHIIPQRKHKYKRKTV